MSVISAYMDFRPGTLLRGAMMCVCLFNEIRLYHRHSFNISPYMDIRPGTLLHDVMMCVCLIIEFNVNRRHSLNHNYYTIIFSIRRPLQPVKGDINIQCLISICLRIQL